MKLIFKYRKYYVFTPDGDGINDFFKVAEVKNTKCPFRSIKCATLKIFNRFSEKVWEENIGSASEPIPCCSLDETLFSWDGSGNHGVFIGNNELPASVYFVVITFCTCHVDYIYNGTVTLFRPE